MQVTLYIQVADYSSLLTMPNIAVPTPFMPSLNPFAQKKTTRLQVVVPPPSPCYLGTVSILPPVVPPLSFHLDADLGRFRPVVGLRNLPEPRVVEGLLGRDAVRRVVHEDFAQ